jgi:cyclopropane fatty-acyl-phospholipid synthase-like methyltransferase
MSESLAAKQWDVEYAEGHKYGGEPPIGFTDKIIEDLGQDGEKRAGLYVGCGNGRNYIPLLDAGLRIHGIDISKEGIHQIQESRPKANVLVRDFIDPTSMRQASVWDYLVAIQVFQHGDRERVNEYFAHAHRVLRPGGRLYLRLNSVSTEIDRRYKKIEGSNEDGKTILYRSGPKKGQEIHFFSKKELGNIATSHLFNVIEAPYEVIEKRKPPRRRTWTQWETIWQKA